MRRWPRKVFRSQFVSPDIEARYYKSTREKFVREDRPYYKIFLIAGIISYLIVPTILPVDPLPYFFGFLPILGSLLYGVFLQKLPKPMQAPFWVAMLCPISAVGIVYFSHRTSLPTDINAATACLLLMLVLFVMIPATIPLPIRIFSNLLSFAIVWTFIYATAPDFGIVARNIGIASAMLLSAITVYAHKKEVFNREVFELNHRIQEVLHDVLPKSIAENLIESDNETSNPPVSADASVMFADIVGFTALTSSVESTELFKILNELFSRFDMLASICGVEKIKTIGDAYMCASGVPDQCGDHPLRCANMALEVRESMEKYRKMTGIDLHVRIGLCSGPVIAGVLGRSRFHFDLWGETVNRASRLESNCPIDQILVDGPTKERLQEHFTFSEKEVRHVKGLGEVAIYVLHKPRLPLIEKISA